MLFPISPPRTLDSARSRRNHQRIRQDGRRGSEFLSYGVKHLKTWVVNDAEQWQASSASFGTDHIENVLSAIFVPALHYMAAPGDSCIITGFASGAVGGGV